MKQYIDVYIEKDGRCFYFKNEDDEDPNMFMEKCWFMVRNVHKHTSISDMAGIADLWIHKKYFGLQYPDHIEAILATL